MEPRPATLQADSLPSEPLGAILREELKKKIRLYKIHKDVEKEKNVCMCLCVCVCLCVSVSC